MKTRLLRLTALMLFAVIFIMSLPLSGAAAAHKTSFELTVDGIDCKTDQGGKLFLYPNKTDSVRKIKADEYNFKPTNIMIFDSTGKLIECGKNLYANTPEKSNSPQEYIYIPAGGFAIAFNSNADNRLKSCFNTAMEGAMLYNATMSVIYEVNGSFDESTKKLKIEYPLGVKPSKDAIKFLFVGNSSTYFNGTPIKFKALAAAAGKEVDVTYCTYGAAFFSEFADETHERGIAFRNALKLKKYDYVVLQDAGAATYEVSKPALDVLIPLVRENGATPLLYMRYSGDKVPENRPAGARVHYDNYTQLSKDFDITVAPAAEAFLVCTEKYPEINLYADDKGHHSKEGSYLIACTWLYRYLGIDPRGNTYTAEMDAETLAALQECAYITCEEGYFDRKPTVSEPESVEPEAESSLPQQPADESGNDVWIYITIGAVVLIAVCAVATVVIKNKKK